MTASEEAKHYGLKSLTQAAQLLGITTQTLREHHKHNRQRFEILMLGCVEYLKKSEIK